MLPHVATDGSVISNTASFGFVAASCQKAQLVTGCGPAAGEDPQSFRAELFGALAASCMLHRLLEYTGIPLSQPYKHYMDNQSTIKQLTREELNTRHYANFSLSSDWDVITTTAAVTKLLPPHEFVWQKGHLDKDPHRDSLDFTAQLNCETDDKAGLYQPTNLPTTPARLS